jgi:GT2 family glycosyltransferase
MTGLSIVVVTWNSAREIGPLLDSIERHLRGAYEVVVVDNGSSDGTVDVLQRRTRPVWVVLNDHNAGFGAANNRGVRQARHDAVILLNPDTLLVDGSLTALAQHAIRRCGLCGPLLLNHDGTRQPSASALPGGWEDALRLLVPGGLMPPALARRCEPWRSKREVEVGWLTGACVAAPRDVLLALGPFDERIHLFSEDLDLGLRARRAGVPSFFVPDVARVVHLGDRSASQAFADAGATESVRNRRRSIALHHGPLRARYDLAVLTAYHSVRLAAKWVLRRDVAAERRWLRAIAAARRDVSP